MARKIYSVSGKSSAIYNIPVGKTFVRVEFSGGNLDPKYFRKATFQTDSKLVQFAIENCGAFGSLIKLERVIEDETPTAPIEAQKPSVKVEAPAEDATPEDNVYPDVTSVNEMFQVLKSRGAKAMQLKDADTMLVTAKRMGVSFPNLKLED